MTDVPRDSMGGMNDDDEAALDDLDEDENSDRRLTQRRFDKRVEKNGELSDSEDEDMNEANGIRKQPSTKKRRAILNYRHIMDVNDSGLDSGVGTPLAGSSLPDVDEDTNMDEAAPEEPGRGTPSPAHVTNGSTNASGMQSPQVPPDDDVTMGDADPAPADPAPTSAQQPSMVREATPPNSPPEQQPATVLEPVPSADAETMDPAIKEEIIPENAVVAAEAVGVGEREVRNAEGEARTETVAKAES